jgi:hypothetical protein
MSNQATFKESSSKRPWFQRLTPIAWVLVAVVAVSCLAFAVIGGGWAVPKLFASEEWATKTPTPTATGTPEPTEGPTPTPTEWWEGDATATPEATEVEIVEPFPAWWAGEMVQDDDGQWWPPEEIVEVAKTHGEERSDAYTAFMETVPPDLDGYEEAMTTYFSGEYLDDRRAVLGSIRAGERDVGLCMWDLCLRSVQEFSQDGLSCSLSVACQDGTCVQIDPDTGTITSSDAMAHSGLSVFRMIYDPIDGRWKVDHRTEYIPPPQ